jgi:hypothetical protein
MVDIVALYAALTLCAIAGALVAEENCRSVRAWACLSFLCPLPALVIVCALGPKRRT